MKTLKSTLAAAALVATAALGAQAETYGPEGATGEQVAEALADAGYRAELLTDSSGDPMIETSFSGSPAVIVFYNCNEGACQDIQFSYGLDLEDGTTLEKVNEWNRSKLYGEAYLDDEDDPILGIVLQVGPGGSSEQIAAYLDLAEIIIAEFKTFF